MKRKTKRKKKGRTKTKKIGDQMYPIIRDQMCWEKEEKRDGEAPSPPAVAKAEAGERKMRGGEMAMEKAEEEVERVTKVPANPQR